MRRRWRLLQLLAYVLWCWLSSYVRIPNRGRGPYIYWLLTELSGAWIKLGQWMGMRYDLFPGDVCDALRNLQYKVQVTPGKYATNIVEEEIGPVSQHFSLFDSVARNGATMSQVHFGRLLDGRPVAIKIIQEGVRPKWRSDLRTMTVWGWVITRLRPRLRLPDLVREMRAVSNEELDLRMEGSHMHKMESKLRKHGLHVAQVYYATQNVLVMDWIEGVVLADLMADPSKIPAGVNMRRMCQKFHRSLLRQAFEMNRFHGDLNPGNIMITADGRAFFIDFGTTNSTDRSFLYVFTSFVAALSIRDYKAAADQYCRLCIWKDKGWIGLSIEGLRGSKQAELRRQLERVMSVWCAKAEVAALPFHEKSINTLSVGMMNEILSLGGSMQWGWLRITRAFTTEEAWLAEWWPEIDHMKELRRYLRKAARRERLNPIYVPRTINMILRALERLDELGQLRTSLSRLDNRLEGL